MVCGCYFFFSSRRRHTRSKRDWSSDVCSSDLRPDADFAEQRRQRHARPLARAGEAVDELRREIGPNVAIAGAAVPGALDEVKMGLGGEAFERVEIEHRRTLDHAVDEQLVALRIDGGHARGVAFEV